MQDITGNLSLSLRAWEATAKDLHTSKQITNNSFVTVCNYYLLHSTNESTTTSSTHLCDVLVCL